MEHLFRKEISINMDSEILRLKREFREKWPREKAREIKALMKRDVELDMMGYLCDRLFLECAIAKLARGEHANVVGGPLLGSGCKFAYPSK